MDTFRWMAVTLAMILGLGVTRVLTGLIAVFKSRHHATLDWIPLAWAGATFVLQIQFWWAIIELPNLIATWTLIQFLMLLGIPISLFLAAALVLPSAQLSAGENMAELFDRDGRWGLLCLSGYALLALLINESLFSEPLWAPSTLFLAAECALPLLFLTRPARLLRAGLAAAYLLLVLVSSWMLSPKSY